MSQVHPELHHLRNFYAEETRKAIKAKRPTKAYLMARGAAHVGAMLLDDNPTLFESAPPGRQHHRVHDAFECKINPLSEGLRSA